MASQFDEFTWQWASVNVAEDFKEQQNLLFSLMETLTWWLQPELKKEMERKKANMKVWPAAKNYIEELRKHGVSEAYIQKELEEIAKENGETKPTADDEIEEIVVLRGPNGTK